MVHTIRRFIIASSVVMALLSGLSAQAGWVESFDGPTPDLNWQFFRYPAISPTFTHTILTEPGGNKYLSLDETNSAGSPPPATGSAFGIGFGSNEQFTDVRVAAVVNVVGDADRHYHGLGARASYFIDDGSITGVPGIIVTTTYVMHIDWQGGPANLSIDIEKVVNMQNMMAQSFDTPVPGIGNNHSFYAVLDVVGSGPVYVTGSLYEYPGGPLVARTRTMVDTAARDPWEDEGVRDAPILSGLSGIFGQNERSTPAGYHTTFDTVSSLSNGPAAVNPSPADGAVNVSIDADLSWVEAAFATGRKLWFGKAGNMVQVSPDPAGRSYALPTLDLGTTYQWRVDETGPGDVTVEGHVWTFTTEDCRSIDGFETYASDSEIQAAWPDNIPDPYIYSFLETGANNVHSGGKSMRFEYQNQADPYYTTVTRTFAVAQDWSSGKALSLWFRGDDANYRQALAVWLVDSAGHAHDVTHPYDHAVQAETWQQWVIDLQEFADDVVSLSAIRKIIIKTGNGTPSEQPPQDRDAIYIDDIRLCPAMCYNSAGLDLRGDVNGDCAVDFRDLAVMAQGWLNNGLASTP